MQVLVNGVGSYNGGAELMLIAAAGRVTALGARPAADVRRTRRATLRRYGVAGYLSVPRLGRAESLGLAALPAGLTARLGLASSRSVAAVLDASGYAFGDGWPAPALERRAAAARSWSRRGVPAVYLPQAFGPFRDQRVREASRAALGSARLVHARDEESLGHLRALGLPEEILRLTPDVTIGLHPPRWTDELPGDVAVVPNVNLVARSDDPLARERYVAALLRVVDELGRHGHHGFLLLHSTGGDATIAEACRARRPALPVVVPPDGLTAKAVLARCRGVVSGRFHGLVSALSSGVPSVAHSWSHKYGHLLEDFGAPGLLCDPFDGTATAGALLDAVADTALAERTRERATALGTRVEAMWAEVGDVLRDAARG